MSPRAASLVSAPRPVGETSSRRVSERVAVLEERQRSNDERAGKTDERLDAIEKNVRLLLDIVQRVTGARTLVVAIGSFVGITAATVTATVAAIRYFTGH